MPIHDLDRAIDGLARRQRGVFHRRQAVRIGFTRSMLRTRLDNRVWTRFAGTQVFALPSHRADWLRQCMAATLTVPDGAVSGPSAAALLGFPGWPRARIEVCTRHGTTHRTPLADVRETRTVGRLVVVEGIRLISPADCIIQIAPLVTAKRLTQIVDDGRRDRRDLLAELGDRYAALAFSRLPGIGNVREALAAHGDGTAPPANVLERKLRTVLGSVRGLPPVRWEATPPWLERGAGRVDALVEAWRLVVEADGRDWHTRVADFEYDRWRDAEALANGYETIRLTWHRLTRHPAWCRNVIAAVGARRSGLGGGVEAA